MPSFSAVSWGDILSSDGKLTPAEREKAVAWINRKAPQLSCPSCGQRKFTLGENYLAPPVWYGGNMMLGGISYPMFFLVCDNCFHVMTYSAIASGVLVPSQPAPISETPEPNEKGEK